MIITLGAEAKLRKLESGRYKKTTDNFATFYHLFCSIADSSRLVMPFPGLLDS